VVVVALAAAWGLYEAGWVRLRELEVIVPGLPPELDGLRIAHLSDFHLGVPSRGAHAVARAVDWVAQRKPDLTVVTGDLLSRPSGEARLHELLGRLDHPYVVLGNHDFAESRDPFSKEAGISELAEGTLLLDHSVRRELRRRKVELAGVDPREWMAGRLRVFGESDADLRILLCHFPRVLDRLPAGRFQLVLSGHIHAGQIVIPYGFGRLNLAHPRARFASGLYRRHGTVMHVSPGLGTTFVPFRFFARPEATELTLRSR
jgi:predicted MPP superfamily phosphohydrolase